MKYNAIIRKLTVMLLLIAIITGMYLPAALAGFEFSAAPGHRYDECYIGFAARDAVIYRYHGKTDTAKLQKGYPFYVVGHDPSDKYYIISSRSGHEAYILKSDVSKTLPAGCCPFAEHDPKWEESFLEPILMLHPASHIHEYPRENSRTLYIRKNTAVRILGKSNGFYKIRNLSNGEIAWLDPSDLVIFLSWAV